MKLITIDSNKYNEEINTPMGMIDVLPTLGNMLNIHNDYQLGNDIFNIKDGDNLVVFTDGSYLTNKIYYSSQKNEIYPLNNQAVEEQYVALNSQKAEKLIEISNDIITYDLLKELKEKEDW